MLYIGKDVKNGTKVALSDEARKANLGVFGIKNTGKAYTVIPTLISQDLNDKNRGMTIVVDTPDLAWYLCGICKEKGRKFDLIKPSININIMNGLLFKPEWDYDDIDKIYSYEKAIKQKKVVIIDMEQERYGEQAVRAVSMLLLQLQSVMIMDRPKKINYSVFIDNAADYVPYIHNLLKYGDYYGFSSTLFFKSREELEGEKRYVDDYIRNFILLQGINYEDAKYFGERMGLTNNILLSAQKLMDRTYGSVQYEILKEGSYERLIGQAELFEFDPDVKKKFVAAGIKEKKKAKEVDTGNHHYQLSKEKESLTSKEETNVSKDLEKDMERSLEGSSSLEKENPTSANNAPVQKEDITKTVEDVSLDELNNIEIDETMEISEVEVPDIETSDIEKIEYVEEVQEKGKEPQLNKKIKTQTFKKNEVDMSSIEQFDLPNSIEEIEYSDEPTVDEELRTEGPTEDIPEPEKETFPLVSDLNKTFGFGGKKKDVRYRNVTNRRIEKELEDFKL